MSGKIIIESVRLDRSEHAHRVVASITQGGQQRELFFSVTSEYGEYLDAERADCFVVGLLAQAAMDGVDIESRVAVTESLLFQLNRFWCGIVAKIYGQRVIKVSAPNAPAVVRTAAAVGTGITGGVDSLYTISEYSKTEYPEHNLTHLCLFNVGGHHIASEAADEIRRSRLARARRFCEEFGYPFVEIDSNLNEYAPNYAEYYSMLNAAAVMSLPKLFARYYNSSGVSVENFHLTRTGLAYFEIFVLDVLSTPMLEFYSAGAEVSRFAKAMRLTAFKPSYDYLDVCNEHAVNCGVCIKCLRTLYALDILDALDNYSKVFDVAAYRRNRKRYLAECWVRVHFARDEYACELYPLLKAKYRIPIAARFRAAGQFVLSRLKIYDINYIRYRLSDR